MGQSGHPDVSWAKAFSADGGTAILTSDKGFTKGPQRKAIEGTGLQVVLLPEKWAFSTVYYQAAFILFWWSKIFREVGDIANYSEKTVDRIRLMLYKK